MIVTLLIQMSKLATSYPSMTLCSLSIGQSVITGEHSPLMLPVSPPKPQLLAFGFQLFRTL
jgi:hypothetical protein